MTIAATALEL